MIEKNNKPTWLDQVAEVNVPAPAGAGKDILDDKAYISEVLKKIADGINQVEIQAPTPAMDDDI